MNTNHAAATPSSLSNLPPKAAEWLERFSTSPESAVQEVLIHQLWVRELDESVGQREYYGPAFPQQFIILAGAPIL